MADWVVTSKNGRVAIYGARKIVKGIPRDRLSWRDQSGKQRHSMLAVDANDPNRAKRVAKIKAEEIAKGKAEANLSRADRLELLESKDALFECGISPSEAARTMAAIMRKLEGTGAEPLDAIQFYLESHPIESAKVDTFQTGMVQELKDLGKSERYIRDQRLMAKKVAESFPDRKIATITTKEIERFLVDGGGQPKTYNNRRSSLFTLFQWAIRKGYARKNPVESIPKRKESRSITCYTAEDVSKILAKCDDALKPWVLLQAFGCLRSSEVCRVEWGKHVDPVRGIIRATHDITKTEQTRIIEMEDNLKEWLIPLNRFSGPVYRAKSENAIGKRNRIRLAEAIKAAKVKPIPNGLRKSCASHLVPRCDHIGAAAEMMGHTVAEMKRSYRELVSKEDSDKYWSITPQGVRKALSVA